VLGLHAYTHQYTPDKIFLGQKVPNTTYPWGGYDQGWDSAEREAKAMDVALFMEEFGTETRFDDYILKSDLREAEKHRVGYAFWTWKENGTRPADTWGVFDPPVLTTDSSGCMRGKREQLLAGVYPRNSADSHLTFQYDSDTGAFALTASGRAGDPSTVVYVPAEVAGDVVVWGAATWAMVANPDGSRLVAASPNGGEFSVSVAAHPRSLSGCA